MVIEIKKPKSVFIILGIIGLLSVIASILIVAFVEDRQSVPYINDSCNSFFCSINILYSFFDKLH